MFDFFRKTKRNQSMELAAPDAEQTAIEAAPVEVFDPALAESYSLTMANHLPVELRARVEMILALHENLRPSNEDLTSQQQYLLKAMLTNFLPEAISQYIRAERAGEANTAISGTYTAAQVCEQSLMILQTKLENIAEDQSRHDTVGLLVTRNTLAERLGIHVIPEPTIKGEIAATKKELPAPKVANNRLPEYIPTLEDWVKVNIEAMVADWFGGLDNFCTDWSWDIRADYEAGNLPVGQVKELTDRVHNSEGDVIAKHCTIAFDNGNKISGIDVRYLFKTADPNKTYQRQVTFDTAVANKKKAEANKTAAVMKKAGHFLSDMAESDRSLRAAKVRQRKLNDALADALKHEELMGEKVKTLTNDVNTMHVQTHQIITKAHEATTKGETETYRKLKAEAETLTNNWAVKKNSLDVLKHKLSEHKKMISEIRTTIIENAQYISQVNTSQKDSFIIKAHLTKGDPVLVKVPSDAKVSTVSRALKMDRPDEIAPRLTNGRCLYADEMIANYISGNERLELDYHNHMHISCEMTQEKRKEIVDQNYTKWKNYYMKHEENPYR